MSVINLDKSNFDSSILRGTVLVDFWAPWCGPCKLIAPLLEEIGSELNGKASIYKVNVDEQQELSDKFGIISIPTLIVFKEGREVDKMTGVPYNNAKREIKKLIERHLY
ncbi:MAG: thioredoxin [Clostridia bacterium]|nr:thioredoxin [Clostridia bacterium]